MAGAGCGGCVEKLGGGRGRLAFESHGGTPAWAQCPWQEILTPSFWAQA